MGEWCDGDLTRTRVADERREAWALSPAQGNALDMRAMLQDGHLACVSPVYVFDWINRRRIV
jgi:hypothetical protein